MNLKETTTVTDTSSIALLGVVADGGALAFAAGIGIGASVPHVLVSDANGNWEIGNYILASAKVLQRQNVESSSNNAQPVAFPAGPKTVTTTIPDSAALKTARISTANGNTSGIVDVNGNSIEFNGRLRLPYVGNNHIRKVAGKYGTASTGATAQTHHAMIAADQPFEWARVWLANADTANALTGIAGIVAVTDTSRMDIAAGGGINPTYNNGASIDNTIQAIGAGAAGAQTPTGWNALQFGGASTGTVPAAPTNSGTTAQVSLLASDWVRRRSIPRYANDPGAVNVTNPADANPGSLPLALARILVPAANANYSFPSQYTGHWNPSSGRVYRMSRQAVDGVTTPSAYTQTGEGSSGNIIAGMEFMGSMPTLNVMSIGDSTDEGFVYNSAGEPALVNPQTAWPQAYNWGFYATDALAQQGYNVSLCQMGWTGGKSIDYYAQAKTWVNQFRPNVVFFQPGSSNDNLAGLAVGLAAQALIDRQVAQAMDFADFCARLGIVCVFTTQIPNNALSASLDAYRVQLNTRIKSTKNPVADFDAAVTDGATPARMQPKFSQGDPTPHPNDGGHVVMGAMAGSQLLRIINANINTFA